jgi:spermidine synthase
VRSLQPTREGNTVLLAIKGADVPDRATLVERAQIVESRFGLPARKWLRMIRELPAGVAG